MEREISIKFWGTRGSIPTPGQDTVKYGGNTTCVEIRIENHLIILDAGTGIRRLGQKLCEKAGKKDLSGHIFITHTHWDHIQGFPFFNPLFQETNRFTIYSDQSIIKSVKTVLLEQMKPEYFPVAFHDIRAQITFNGFSRNIVHIADLIKIESFLLNHTTGTVGYKITYADTSVVFATDNEPYDDFSGNDLRDRQLIAFCDGAAVLIHDAQYTGAEYELKRGWGHSSIDHALRLAQSANINQLYLFHHDPSHNDAAIDEQLVYCREHIQQSHRRFECYAAEETKMITIPVL